MLGLGVRIGLVDLGLRFGRQLLGVQLERLGQLVDSEDERALRWPRLLRVGLSDALCQLCDGLLALLVGLLRFFLPLRELELGVS